MIAALAFVSGVPAADLPTPGTKTTTKCRFEPRSELLDPGITLCNSQISTITAGTCNPDGTRTFDFGDRFVAREYQGKAMRHGLNGVEVQGTFEDVVRPHARFLFEGSGFDSFQERLPDPSCT